ncbi:MAG TPA: 16S rRNA (adenine(1518)-N(6)/adenine(1519)-N(6))-dimethyltransferase RsmA [Streptosporangiaceae bacterium]
MAARLELRPAKRLGQNFVVDSGTIRRIVALAGVGPDDHVLEVGPGLGSLTLGLLDAARRVLAIEIDPVLAAELPRTVASVSPEAAGRLSVVTADAARITALPDPPPGAGPPSLLVANLPYNAAVPVLLHLLATVPSMASGIVMVQAEVADRMTAPPGSRIYGIPSVKLAWYAQLRRAGSVPRSVFWPVPRVDSGLVAFTRHDPPALDVSRAELFAAVDAAFAQRRKMLRSALAPWAGSAADAERVLRAADVDPSARGESLGVAEFARLAAARARLGLDGSLAGLGLGLGAAGRRRLRSSDGDRRDRAGAREGEPPAGRGAGPV